MIVAFVAAALASLPLSVSLAAAADSLGCAVEVVKANRQQSFAKTVPPGNYSGVAWLGGSRYAVVSDKSPSDGFFVFDIRIDSVSGKIQSVYNEGFFSAETPNRDQEGIACGDIDVHCFGEKRGSIPTTLENTWIEMRIHGSGDIPEERILSCIEKTKETCSMYQTIRQVSAMHVKFEVIRG